MNIKVLKVGSKRSEKGNFTQLGLQVVEWNAAEELSLLNRKDWGIYTDSPWVRIELQSEVTIRLTIEGVSFAATMQRAKLSRVSTEASAKITLVLQKDICEADMLLSALVGAKNEDGVPCSYYCEVSEEQLAANLEGEE
jgi:hypothetical protein